MTALGTVVEILTPTLVLIQSDAEFGMDDVLVVFAEVPVQQLTEKYGLESIHYRRAKSA
jgi:hypothetical protein